MQAASGIQARAVHVGAAMRPRRWYTDEVAPPRHNNAKVTALTWRYHSLVRGRKHDAAPAHGAASLCWCNFI
jgi:hypothetical protein